MLSPEELALHQTIDRGRRLRELILLPGWQDVLDIMEKEVVDAEVKLMQYAGSDKDVLTGLHRRARSKREFFDQVQVQIASAIDAADELHTRPTPPAIGDPGHGW